MPRSSLARAVRLGASLLLLMPMAAACSGGGDRSRGGDSGAAGDQPSAAAASSGGGGGGGGAASTTFAVTEADLDAYERGIAKEIELVKAAQEKQSKATTPEARGEAIQAQWREQTMPAGAQSAGLAPDRYRDVRETVHHLLETLDFQGKIDGPMSMDTTNASPEMRKRLTSDPYAALPPASAAAIRGRLDRLAKVWGEYVRLTAVAG